MTVAPQRDVVIVDLTGIVGIPAEFVETLAHAHATGQDVEILNPSPEVQEYLRRADLSSILIRGSTPPRAPI